MDWNVDATPMREDVLLDDHRDGGAHFDGVCTGFRLDGVFTRSEWATKIIIPIP
jgi:hypothetical protein